MYLSNLSDFDMDLRKGIMLLIDAKNASIDQNGEKLQWNRAES